MAIGAPVSADANTKRLDWLDALRGWAVLGVVSVHSAALAHNSGLAGKIAASGQYGVQLFFIISALTISLTYDSHIRRFGRSIRSQFAWLIKRFFRIAPLYYLAAILYPIEQYGIYVLSHQHVGHITTIADIAANLLFINTWIPSANNSVVPGGWSIGVEMFFYLTVPLIWMITPSRPKRRAIWLCVAAVSLLMVTELVSKATTGGWYVHNNRYLYFWFPTQAPVIIAGLALYFLNGSQLKNLTDRKQSILFLTGSVICAAAGLYCGTSGEWMPAVAPVIFGVGFCLLILGMNRWMKGILVNKFSVELGKISYSVYLIHFVVLDGMHFVVSGMHLQHYGSVLLPMVILLAVLIASGLARMTKRVIEDPFINYGHRLSGRIASVETEPSIAR